MKGLALPSGNDAAVAVAVYVAGSVKDFVRLMNQEALRLGFSGMQFTDSSGLSEYNKVTARDFAEFCRFYVKRHPYSIEELHSVTEFVFPRAENLPSYTLGSRQPLVRPNHNDLLGKLDGVNGLKTGYIDESGYNIALSASRGSMNLIAVILGVQGNGSQEGSLNRAIDSASLLSYGFYAYSTIRPVIEELTSVRVYRGRERTVPVTYDDPLVTVKREDLRFVKGRFSIKSPLVAPFKEGDIIGHVSVSLGGTELRQYPVKIAVSCPRAEAWRVFLDSLVLAFKKVFNSR